MSATTNETFLRHVSPMGIYETLYAFKDAFGEYMGSTGTHPWSQGFPLTTQLPGGPPIPDTVTVDSKMLMYPKAWGLPELRETVAQYYNKYYGSKLKPENIMIFAGGRPALIAILLFLHDDIVTRIASTEYTPYYDMLRFFKRRYELVESNKDNKFLPPNSSYFSSPVNVSYTDRRTLALISNPCNPTGKTRCGDTLKEFVQFAMEANHGAIIDEAYELFHGPPVSAMQYIPNIDATNIFITGACTKGFQSPGIRVGWCIASQKSIEILSNFSSFAMGGVSALSQQYALQLFEPTRVELCRSVVSSFYESQRKRYGAALEGMGLKLHTGDGGFYHWVELPDGMCAADLNPVLFKRGAAILKGTDCDMTRRKENSTLASFFRFSFGPLKPDSFEEDMKILKESIDELRATVV